MPIPVQCPHCQKRFRVDDKHAGKRTRCPHCQAGTIEIPLLQPTAAESDPFDPLSDIHFPMEGAPRSIPMATRKSASAQQAQRFWVKLGIGSLIGAVALAGIVALGMYASQKISEMALAASNDTKETEEKETPKLSKYYRPDEPLPDELETSPIPWTMFRHDSYGYELALIEDMNLLYPPVSGGEAFVSMTNSDQYWALKGMLRRKSIPRDTAIVGVVSIGEYHVLDRNLYTKIIQSFAIKSGLPNPKSIQVDFEPTMINGYHAAEVQFSGYSGLGSMGGFLVFAKNGIGTKRMHHLVLYTGPQDVLTSSQIKALRSTFRMNPSEYIEKGERQAVDKWRNYYADLGIENWEPPPPLPPAMQQTLVPWHVFRHPNQGFQMIMPDSLSLSSNVAFLKGGSVEATYGGWFSTEDDLWRPGRFVVILDRKYFTRKDATPETQVNDIRKLLSNAFDKDFGQNLQIEHHTGKVGQYEGRHFTLSSNSPDQKLFAFTVHPPEAHTHMFILIGCEALLPDEYVDLIKDSIVVKKGLDLAELKRIKDDEKKASELAEAKEEVQTIPVPAMAPPAKSDKPQTKPRRTSINSIPPTSQITEQGPVPDHSQPATDLDYPKQAALPDSLARAPIPWRTLRNEQLEIEICVPQTNDVVRNDDANFTQYVFNYHPVGVQSSPVTMTITQHMGPPLRSVVGYQKYWRDLIQQQLSERERSEMRTPNLIPGKIHGYFGHEVRYPRPSTTKTISIFMIDRPKGYIMVALIGDASLITPEQAEAMKNSLKVIKK